MSKQKKEILNTNNSQSLKQQIKAQELKQLPVNVNETADIEMKLAEGEFEKENNAASKNLFSLKNIEEENKNTRKYSILSEQTSNINEFKKSEKNVEQAENETNLENNLLSKTSAENLNINNIILFNKCKLEEIGITFTLPGCEIDLKENGSEVNLDANNLEEYINLIFKTLCFEGIGEAVKAFKKGFNLVFPIKSLRCFHSFEISELICGANSEAWNEQVLVDAIVPNYGYDKNW